MNKLTAGIPGKLVLPVVLLLVSQAVSAAGFYITEVGTPTSLGTGGVANPTNTHGADAAWTNPAGMTGLDSDMIVAGVQVVVPNIRFDSSIAEAGGSDGGNAGNTLPIPSFFYVNRFSDRLRLGFSVAGIQGGGVDYGDGFVGRYSTTMAELGAIGISPSLGFKVNDKFSVGAGVSIIYTRFDENIAINQAGPDGKLKIEEATDWGYQPFIGMTWGFSERTLLGVVYRAEMDVDLDGDVNTHNVNLPILADDVKVDWTNPQWLEAGLKHQLDDKNTLFLNAGWQDWSRFSKNTLGLSGGILNPSAKIDRKFDDTWQAGIAFAHSEGDHGTSIGFSYESSPVDDKHRTLDLPFEEFYKVSMAYFWKGDKALDFSLGGTLYLVGDADIDQTSQGVRTKGDYDSNTILFLGGTARYVF